MGTQLPRSAHAPTPITQTPADVLFGELTAFAGQYFAHLNNDVGRVHLQAAAQTLVSLRPDADYRAGSQDARLMASVYLALAGTLHLAPWDDEAREVVRGHLPDLTARLTAHPSLRATVEAHALNPADADKSMRRAGAVPGEWLSCGAAVIEAMTDDDALRTYLTGLVANAEQRAPWRQRRGVDLEREALVHYVNYGIILPVSEYNLETPTRQLLAMLDALLLQQAPCGVGDVESAEDLRLIRAFQVREAIALFQGTPRWGLEFERLYVAVLQDIGYPDAHLNDDRAGAWDVSRGNGEVEQNKGGDALAAPLAPGDGLRFTGFARMKPALKRSLERVVGPGAKVNGHLSTAAAVDVAVGALHEHFHPVAPDGPALSYTNIIHRREHAVGEHESHVHLYRIPTDPLKAFLEQWQAGTLPPAAISCSRPGERSRYTSRGPANQKWEFEIHLSALNALSLTGADGAEPLPEFSEEDCFHIVMDASGKFDLLVTGDHLIQEIGDYGLLTSPEIERVLAAHSVERISDGFASPAQREAAWAAQCAVDEPRRAASLEAPALTR